MIRQVFVGKVEASDEINFQCGLLSDFPPERKHKGSLIHPKLSFWHARVLKGSGAKGI